ncbi:MAG: GDSL-type esterase/lipase family protein, partial [Lentisphaeria bacterium]
LEVKVFGFPGATSRSALKILRNNPRVKGGIVIVTLGGNDFLRQVPLSQTRQCLKQVFEILQGRGALVVYTGVPGGRTAKYKKLCKNTGVVLVPDVLDNILSQRNLRADRIHPNDQGYKIMAERIAEVLAEDVPGLFVNKP